MSFRSRKQDHSNFRWILLLFPGFHWIGLSLVMLVWLPDESCSGSWRHKMLFWRNFWCRQPQWKTPAVISLSSLLNIPVLCWLLGPGLSVVCPFYSWINPPLPVRPHALQVLGNYWSPSLDLEGEQTSSSEMNQQLPFLCLWLTENNFCLLFMFLFNKHAFHIMVEVRAVQLRSKHH